jgi:hypothetical protein
LEGGVNHEEGGRGYFWEAKKRKKIAGRGRRANFANANEGGWDAIVRNGEEEGKKTNCHIGMCAPVSLGEERP